jgi:hypothetical protein
VNVEKDHGELEISDSVKGVPLLQSSFDMLSLGLGNIIPKDDQSYRIVMPIEAYLPGHQTMATSDVGPAADSSAWTGMTHKTADSDRSNQEFVITQ